MVIISVATIVCIWIRVGCRIGSRWLQNRVLRGPKDRQQVCSAPEITPGAHLEHIVDQSKGYTDRAGDHPPCSASPHVTRPQPLTLTPMKIRRLLTSHEQHALILTSKACQCFTDIIPPRDSKHQGGGDSVQSVLDLHRPSQSSQTARCSIRNPHV